MDNLSIKQSCFITLLFQTFDLPQKISMKPFKFQIIVGNKNG